MKTNMTKKQAQEKINEFFKREKFSAEEIKNPAGIFKPRTENELEFSSSVKKIKQLAMKFNIKLLGHKKKFCKSCLSKLEGKTKVSSSHRIVVCSICGYRNKFKLVSTK
jgi:RNase P subunit RPR2